MLEWIRQKLGTQHTGCMDFTGKNSNVIITTMKSEKRVGVRSRIRIDFFLLD